MVGSKINATVAILTLNSGKTLERCLESVKYFKEIIVCDGNSTDETVTIAKRYKAKVISQFKSKQKNLRIKNKAQVRNTALDASRNKWHVWLDSDDELSKELVQEIKKITSQAKPKHLVWRVPLRHVIDKKAIIYSSNYPLFQIRLFNKKSGARFIKPVHEQVDFDKSNYAEGTLHGYYNIHWSRQRAENFWQTIWHYNKLEVEAIRSDLNLKWYVRWIVGFHLSTLLGMIVRIVWFQIRYSKEEVMPFSIELARLVGKLQFILKATQLLLLKSFNK